MIAATKGFTRWAGLVLAVSLPLISTQAHAVAVTVGGTSYELGSVSGSFTANSALLQRQAWWGSASLASAFATAYKASGSAPASLNLFAYGVNPVVNGDGTSDVLTYYTFGSFANGSYTSRSDDSRYLFMTATASASSVPEINAGSLSQALLMLFALWLVTWRRPSSRVA